MADDNGQVEERIRTYVADRGPAQDQGGRLDTDKMAVAVGVDNAHHLRIILERLERDGVLTREMQGPRTHGITFAPGGGPSARSEADPPSPATVMNGGSTDVGHTEIPAAAAEAASAPAVVAPAPEPTARPLRQEQGQGQGQGQRGPTPQSGDTPVPGDNGAVAPPQQAGKSMSLREAIAQQAKLPEPAAEAPPSSSDVLPSDVLPAAGPIAEPGQLRRWSRALTRQGAATSTPDDTAVPPTTARATASPGPDSPGTIAESPTYVDDDSGDSERFRRGVLMPEMNAPPSNKVLIIVGVTMAVLVLIAVITVLANRKIPRPVPLLDTNASSVDACQVVTTQMATAAFGDNAGPPNLVLGECVYDDGTHELIVEVDRIDAQHQFAAAETSSAQRFPGIGDAAFYVGGSLWVLKGPSLVQITLGPVPATAPPPQLLALATTAAGRLLKP